MLLQASQIIGLPVGATNTQERVGNIADLVIDPDTGRLLGFIVKSGVLGSIRKVLSYHDVTNIDHTAVLVREPEVLLPPEEVDPIKKALKDGRPVLRQRVVTEGGTKLGKVFDLVLNTDAGMVTKLYISHLLEERIIPLDKVVKVTKDHVVVKDDVVLGRSPLAETMAV